MVFKGVVRNGCVELPPEVDLPEGTIVHVEAVPKRQFENVAETSGSTLGDAGPIPQGITGGGSPQLSPSEEWIRQHCGPTHYGEQDEYGVDLSLIRTNLKLTPEERLLRADAARRSALELQACGRKQRKKQSPSIR